MAERIVATLRLVRLWCRLVGRRHWEPDIPPEYRLDFRIGPVLAARLAWDVWGSEVRRG